MGIYNGQGAYTEDACRFETEASLATNLLITAAIEQYHLTAEDFFILMARAANRSIKDYVYQHRNNTNNSTPRSSNSCEAMFMDD